MSIPASGPSRRAFLASLAAVGTIPAALPMVGDTPIPAPAPPTPPPAPDPLYAPDSGYYTITEVTEYLTHDSRRMNQYTFAPDTWGHLWHTEFEVSQWSWRVGDRVRISAAYRVDGAAMFWYTNVPHESHKSDEYQWYMEIKREDGLQ